MARQLLGTMCSHLSKPKHRTTMLFREWKRLFEQVSTYGLDQLPTLKAWAKSQGIATKDASQILFAIHSHYALVVKLLTSELLAAVNPLSTTSVFAACSHTAPADASLQCPQDVWHTASNKSSPRRSARLRKMTDEELIRHGKAGHYLCSPMANFGKPPRKVLVIQLEEVKAEWRRRHQK